MKKIWILEKFITPERMAKIMSDYEGFRQHEVDTNGDVQGAEKIIAHYKKQMEATPDGYWLGYNGCLNYRVFCYDAKQTIRNLRGEKFRVIEGEVEDGAKTWLNYNPVKENPGVLRYLMATL